MNFHTSTRQLTLAEVKPDDDFSANFSEAVDTWLERPHLIHKRLMGSKILSRIEGQKASSHGGVDHDPEKEAHDAEKEAHDAEKETRDAVNNHGLASPPDNHADSINSLMATLDVDNESCLEAISSLKIIMEKTSTTSLSELIQFFLRVGEMEMSNENALDSTAVNNSLHSVPEGRRGGGEEKEENDLAFESLTLEEFISKKNSTEKVFQISSKRRDALICVAFGFLSREDVQSESERPSKRDVWVICYRTSLHVDRASPADSPSVSSTEPILEPFLRLDVVFETTEVKQNEDSSRQPPPSEISPTPRQLPPSVFSPHWLQTSFLETMVKWTKLATKSKFGPSLRLLNIDDYAHNYRRFVVEGKPLLPRRSLF